MATEQGGFKREVPTKTTEVITPVTIGPEFIDQYGHVNYKRFPDIFEAGQNDLMEKCIEGGFDRADSTYGVRNFVKRTDTTVNGQLLAGDKVLQHTSIGRLGTTSITFNQSMEKDGQNVADQTMVVVIVDKDNKPLPIPEDLREKLQSYLIENHKGSDLVNQVDLHEPNKGELVWRKLNEDPDFLKYPKASREAMRPFVEAMPTVLGNMLDGPANLANILKARIKFLSYCIENGVIETTIKTLPKEQRDLFADTTGKFEEMFRGLIDQLTAMTADIPGLLQKLGVKEQQLMLSSQMNLNQEARTLYETGQLTIGKLLLVNPMVIYKNSDE